MKKYNTLNFIISLVRENMSEEFVTPTNSVSSGKISGISGKEDDLPPVDLRKRRYKKIPYHYRNLFRRKTSVQSQ